MVTAVKEEWIGPFTGLSPRQFRELVRVVAGRGGAQAAGGRPGCQWALPLAERVLLVVMYWRTNLTLGQVGPLGSHTPRRIAS